MDKAVIVVTNAIKYTSLCGISALFLFFTTPIYSKDESTAVTLKYDWPAGLAGKIYMEENVIRQDSSGEVNRIYKGNGIIKTESHVDGLLVTISDVDLEVRDADSKEDFSTNIATIMEVAMLENAWLVAPDGELIDVIGSEELASDIRTHYDNMFDGLVDDSEQELFDSLMAPFRGMLESLYSEEQIVETFATEWNQNVKRLDGMRLEIGKPQEVEFETPSVYSPKVKMRHVGAYELIRRLPCRDEETDNRCVEIIFTSKPTEESAALLDEYIAETLKHMFRDFEELQPELTENFSMPDSQSSVTIVTEPLTLIPHQVITRTTESIDMRSDYGGKRVTVTEDITQYVYQ